MVKQFMIYGIHRVGVRTVRRIIKSEVASSANQTAACTTDENESDAIIGGKEQKGIDGDIVESRNWCAVLQHMLMDGF